MHLLLVNCLRQGWWHLTCKKLKFKGQLRKQCLTLACLESISPLQLAQQAILERLFPSLVNRLHAPQFNPLGAVVHIIA